MKPNLNSNVLTFLAVFVLVVLWDMIGPQVSSAVFLLLDAPHVFPRAAIYYVVSLLPLILFVEVVTRFLLLHSIPDNVVYQPVDADALLGVDRDALTAYTKQLEAIGFTPLMDYQIAESSTGVARLFAHTEHHCFAEVGEFIGRTSMSCFIASVLEQNWRLGTTNRSKNLVSAKKLGFRHCLCIF